MEIIYQKLLRDNPTRRGTSLTNEPISLEEILKLESLYNNGKPFPKALRELLFLAGKYCHCLDIELGNPKDQELPREGLIKYNLAINRPFYAIELCDGGKSHFMYI